VDEPEGVRQLFLDCYGRLVAGLELASGQRAEAEDLVQEAFARLIPKWERVARYDDPEAWVRLVAFRLLIDRRRRMMRALRIPQEPRGATASRADVLIDVERAVSQLPSHQRQVVVLHYLYDLRVEDIARMLHVRVGTVKSRLARSRAALAATLDEEVLYDG
jgi:RNA polymerase sigma-70 factor (ECF subfamily)